MSVIIKGAETAKAMLANRNLGGLAQGAENANAMLSKMRGGDLDTLRKVLNDRPVDGPKGAPLLDKFGKALEAKVDSVNEVMNAADVTAEGFLKGEDTSIHEVMLAMSKADVSFKLMTRVGRKAVEAYQEISRMQV